MNTVENWPRCPEAAQWFAQLFHAFAAANPQVEMLARQFQKVGVDILTLVDHWILSEAARDEAALTAYGLSHATMPEGDEVWSHPQARLPKVRFKAKRATPCLALRVDSVEDFAQANGLTYDSCHGEPNSGYQCAHLALPEGELMPIARRGYAGFAPRALTATERANLAQVEALFLERDRSGAESEVVARAQTLVEQAVALVGQDRAADVFFAAERVYYETRNAAARYQYAQQQQIGIGWANHDHHTFRSSRTSFRALIRLFHTLGFCSREKFYAGAEAGWGAQVLEHPVSRVVIFADVDMSPNELSVDYASVDLPPRDTLGTIGLWCALHTSSIAQAGLHHLECEFDFAQAEANMKAAGFGVMPPFTDLPMLKQAFTVAETWPVARERVEPLVAAGLITREQAEKFVVQGAPGSHLEILQRWEGFKGFNKTGISAIIRDTDARN
jgi:hypothetical protein